MGKKDLWQSDYFDDKKRFADAFNGALFGGRNLIHAEDLEDDDSTIVHHLMNKDSVKIICDKIRKWKGQYLSIFILENQSYVDYRMILRVMLEEAVGYERQRKRAYQAAKASKYNFSKNECLSGMKKTQKFIPIITLILYMGTEEKWDGAKTLYELLEIDEDLKPFVTNYKLNFYDYHEHNDFSNFKTENRLIFELLSNHKDKKKMKQILQENSKSCCLDREAAIAILGIIDRNINLDDIKEFNDEKEEYNVCKAWEDMRMDAKNEGIEIGIQTGIQTGHDEEQRKNVKSLMKNLDFSLEQALDALDIQDEDRKKYYS